MAFVVEMAGYDKVADVEKTVRFAMGEGIAFSDGYAPGALMRWASASQRIEIGSSGRVGARGNGGEVMIANFPDTVWEEGPWDTLADWVWQNRRATVYEVDGADWDGRVFIATGILEQPVATLEAGSSSISSVLRFPIRDPRAVLDTPLQTVRYAGTNVGPDGLEGGEELKGRPKPIIYGLVSNISPPRVNSSLLIHQIADKAVTVLCVRDGAIPITLGTIRASLATLVANIPLGGRYDIYAGAEGTFIRLGTTPVFNLTVDADEAADEISQGHARIWDRLSTRIGRTTDAASIAAAEAIDDAGAGFYWDQEITQAEALDEVLGSFSAFETELADGSWMIEKLILPAGAPAVDLIQLDPGTRLKATSRPLIRLSRVRPDYAPDGAPPFRVNVRWGRNYTVMDNGSFAGGASDRLKDKFALEYRTASASDNEIWDPDTSTGLWPNAPEMTIDTAYQPGDDGNTSPGAQDEADRILALLGPVRGQYQAKYVPKAGDQVRVGIVARATYPRMGLAAGALFRVLEYGLGIENDVMSADMVIGLQA